MNLRTKLLGLILPIVVLPLLALGWVGYIQLQSSTARSHLDQASNLLNHAELRLHEQVATARANVGLLAGHWLLERYLLIEDEGERYSLAQPSLLVVLSDYQRAYPTHYEVRLLLPDGYEDTRSTMAPLANASEEEGDTAFFRNMARDPATIRDQVYRNPDNGELALVVSSRLVMPRDPGEVSLQEPPVLGYLVITSSLAFLEGDSNKAVKESAGYLVIADGSGEVLFRHRKSSPGLEPGPSHQLPPALLAAANSKEFTSTTYQGAQHAVLGRKLADDLHAYFFLPERQHLEQARDLGFLVAGITFLSIIITAGLLFKALKSLLLRPITILRDAALEIGSGEFDAPIDIERADELGELAHSFKEMRRNLNLSTEKIRFIAYHDGLTGLPNRAMVTEVLNHAIAVAERNESILGLLFLDLDDFKRVNDTLGHQGGDELLQQAAERLKGAIRASDWLARADGQVKKLPKEASETIARIGGDEFIVVLPDLERRDSANIVARRVVEAMAPPFELADNTFHVSVSVGISTFPEDGKTPGQLIRSADIAMYHAKEQGKNSFQVFSAGMDEVAAERLAIENALHKALEGDEFTLVYQPQIDLSLGKVVAVEALLRWQSPELGNVPPGTFIPIAEEIGLIISIGEWVMREACRQNRSWQDAGIEGLSVSVNISSRQFNRANFEGAVAECLNDTRLDPSQLLIEITETCIMESEERVARTLAAIQNLGVEISMDDFGTGYSSLSALRRLPIDELKIDQSFVRDMANDPDDASIISAIIAMGRSLNLRVVAEGVEDEDQLARLRDKGCDLVQGYLLSRPIAATEIPAFVRNSLVEFSWMKDKA